MGIVFSGCIMNRYYLSDNGEDKRFLIREIKKLEKNGEISSKPLIVLDGVPYRFNKELKAKRLPVSKDSIYSIESLPDKTAKAIYGERANGGVILITTKTYNSKR